MSIDERLERLTERHEALAKAIRLLAAENKQTTAENKQLDRRMGEIMEGIARLLQAAQIHEQRLERPEG